MFRSWLAVLYLALLRWSIAAFHAAGVVTLLYETYGPIDPRVSAAIVFGPLPFVLASAWPTRLIIKFDHLVVVNGLRRRIIHRNEVEQFEWRRPAYFLAQPAIAVRRSVGRTIVIAASLMYRDAKRFGLSQALSNWLGRPDEGGIRPGRAYKRDFQVLWVAFASGLGYTFASEFMDTSFAVIVAIACGGVAYPIATKVGAFMQEADIDLGMIARTPRPDK